MAKRSAGTNGYKAPKADTPAWKLHFVQCTLSQADKAIFSDFEREEPDTATWLSDVVLEGYKVTISFLDNSGCFNVCLIETSRIGNPQTQAVDAKAATLNRALCLLMWKFSYMLQSDLNNGLTRSFGGSEVD